MDFSYTSIVIAVDGGGHAAQALALGIDMARTLALPVRLVHVVQHRTPTSLEARRIDPTLTDGGFDGSAEDRLGAAVLDEALDQVNSNNDLDIEGVLLAGEPAETLLRYLEECDRPLLVVGRRGRGLWGELLLGSVSDKLVRHARCPVTVVSEPLSHRA
ncbi:MAG: universal stress protein [Wenzhouxiangella sp.]